VVEMQTFKSFIDFGLWYAKQNCKNVYAIKLHGPEAIINPLYVCKPINKKRLFMLIRERSLQPVLSMKFSNKQLPREEVAFYVSE